MISHKYRPPGDGRNGVFDAFIYLLRDPTADQGVQKPTQQRPQQADQGSYKLIIAQIAIANQNLVKAGKLQRQIHHSGHYRYIY